MQTNTIAEKPTILAELKARTAHQHEQTEETVDIMREDFDLEDYRGLLTRFYAFYKPFEENLRAALEKHEVDFNLDGRSNTPKLLDDLRSLGMKDSEIEAITPAQALPALDSKEKIFGSLYVIEGSTLGGQVISRHLKQKFGIEAASGAAFFSGYGLETGKMWKEFGAAITAFAENGANRDEIIKGANETFEKIGKALAQTPK